MSNSSSASSIKRDADVEVQCRQIAAVIREAFGIREDVGRRV